MRGSTRGIIGMVALFALAAGMLSFDAPPSARAGSVCPENTPIPASIDCVYPGTTTIADLNLFVVINHNDVGNLYVSLDHIETGTHVLLIAQIGFPGGCLGASNIYATLDDEASTAVTDGCVVEFVPALLGAYRPDHPLSAFDGESLGGTWRLDVHEIISPQPGGEVAFWSLIICPNADTDTMCNNVDPDDDNDGCTDVKEAGPNPLLGGMRSPVLFWDFFDVPTGISLTRDKSVTAGDIFGVIGRFNSTDTGPGPFYRDDDATSTPIALLPGATRQNYHPAFDRSSGPGPNIWNLGPADGSIAAFDIFAVLGQFNHSCA